MKAQVLNVCFTPRTIEYIWTCTLCWVAGSSKWRKYYATLDYWTQVEASFVVFGWVCLFTIPGIASLRVLRIFTYSKYGRHIDSAHAGLAYLSHSVCVCAKYLESLCIELFSTKTKGSVVLLAMFFYLSYGMLCKILSPFIIALILTMYVCSLRRGFLVAHWSLYTWAFLSHCRKLRDHDDPTSLLRH